MTIQSAYQLVLSKLYEVYDTREAANIADMLIEHVTGQRKIDRIVNRDMVVNEHQKSCLEKFTTELLAHKPIQYVIGEAWFMEMKFRVNNHVLIPRPETEELVDWIVKDVELREKKNLALLDIGTGSGCIPIAVKKLHNDVNVSALDVSKEAVKLAGYNAMTNHVVAEFNCLDFLNENEWKQLGKYDIIVSNPPYIKQSEKALMSKNVLNYEPHLALFVPNDDPLLFYKAIATFGHQHLEENGAIYLEINEALGDLVVRLFNENGYSQVQLKNDIQGKDRMVKVVR